jgi:rare lipoprotein A
MNMTNLLRTWADNEHIHAVVETPRQTTKGKTASGSSFDRNLLTAAHRRLPFGTRVRVIDLETNRSVVVRITDRGPWVRGRVLHLSLAAARSLGITSRGVAQVRAEVLYQSSIALRKHAGTRDCWRDHRVQFGGSDYFP